MRKKEYIPEDIFGITLTDTAEAERVVLNDAVEFDDMFGDVAQVISEEFFTSDARRRIWNKIVENYNTGKAFDFTSIANTMGVEFLDEVGGLHYTAMRTRVHENAFILRAGAAKRRAFFASANFLRESSRTDATEDTILAATEAFARDVEGPAPIMNESLLADVLKDVREEAKQTEEAIKAGKHVRITTGYYTIDKVLNGGFKGGQLVVVAARPSVGKTALMLQMAKGAARSGNPVIIYTLEMPAEELGERLLYSTGEVRPYQFNHGEIEWQAYDRAEQELIPLPMYINGFSRSLDEIVSRTTRAVKQGRCKAIFIDYLGLMSDALNFGNAKLYQVIGRITGTLKTVAKRLGIPIILLCQINREAAREDRAPELFDLRDSGSIEQDADVVLMLDNKDRRQDEEKAAKDLGDNPLFVYLRKQRGGQKDWCFVLVPNDTFSSFQEDEPIPPKGQRQEMHIPEPLTEEEEQEDFYPF